MQYEIIIVGGSYAGLSAALALGRARKRVLIIDAGRRRNRFAPSAHGFLGQDGRAPDAIAAAGRAEVAAYPTVTFLDGTAISAAQGEGGFAIGMADDTTHTAARLILATGVIDDLPDLPGLREGWGKGVIHCPYCHGYEVADRRLGVLALIPFATHQANLIPDWGPTTFLTNGVVSLTAEERAALERRGVVIEEEPVAEIINAGDGLAGVRLTDRRTVALDALFTGVPTRLASPLAAQLGCAIDDTPGGPIIRVDALGQTTVPGVYAAGDATNMMKSLPGAVASGYMVGAATHQSLLPPAH
ncbi:MAG TPA: NAD(P)/FAD-dependent oxidoreductase [Thermomicrobiales bacterium]|jgi:thioredoxin reductase